MGNIVFSKDFITVANAEITAQSTATGFSKANVMDYWHLKRRWRMDSADKSSINPILYFDMGAAKTVAAIMLDDVNFSKVLILGNDTDLSTDWTAAAFTSGELTVSCDAQTGRYKIYIPLTDFNRRWIAVCVPSAASAVGDYQTKWEVGRVVLVDSVNTFTKNMAYGYERGAKRAYQDFSCASGHVERVELGELRWEGTLIFGNRTVSQESDLTTLNNLNIASPIFFYENNSDTSKCYLCLRDTDYLGTVKAGNMVTGTSIRLCELI